jgi:hypothetical protein
MGEMNIYKFLVGRTVGKREMGDLDIDGKILLIRILKYVWTEFKSVPVADLHEHDNDPSECVKAGNLSAERFEDCFVQLYTNSSLPNGSFAPIDISCPFTTCLYGFTAMFLITLTA